MIILYAISAILILLILNIIFIYVELEIIFRVIEFMDNKLNKQNYEEKPQKD